MLAREDELRPLVSEPLRPKAVVAAAFACLSGLLLGYDIGITNGALLPLKRHFGMNHSQMEIFVGMLSMCALPGCFLGGKCAEWFGRRGAIGIGAVFFLLGNSLMTFASTYMVLLLGRALAGLAVGMTLVTEPLYTAEVSPARLRGMLSTNVEVSFNVGIVLGFLSSYKLRDLPDATSWRWMFGLCLAAPVLSIAGVCCVLPESPRWLASQGRVSEAEAVLGALLGPAEASRSAELMKAPLRISDQEPEMTWQEMFTTPNTRWLALLGGGIAFFSQATGIESIMFYSNVILEEGGLDRDMMLLATLIMGCFKLAAIMVQGCVVDITGRRPLLVISSLGMATCMIALGISFILAWGVYFKVIPITLFAVLFSLGYGPLVYTMGAELYPTACRAKGLTLTMGTARVMAAIVAMTFLSLSSLLSMGGAFIFFGLWGVVGAAFVLLFVPETTGKSLEEDVIDDL